MDAGPDVLNHNVETVERLQRRVRAKAFYSRSLEVLRRAKEMRPEGRTKSGLMVGRRRDLGRARPDDARPARRRLRHAHYRPVPSAEPDPPRDRAVLHSRRVPSPPRRGQEAGLPARPVGTARPIVLPRPRRARAVTSPPVPLSARRGGTSAAVSPFPTREGGRGVRSATCCLLRLGPVEYGRCLGAPAADRGGQAGRARSATCSSSSSTRTSTRSDDGRTRGTCWPIRPGWSRSARRSSGSTAAATSPTTARASSSATPSST